MGLPANALMVVGDIRVMSHQKVKGGQHICYLPVKAMAGPTDPLGTQSEADSLSGVRATRDESGPGRTKQDPERRIRASRDGTGPYGTNQGPSDESGPSNEPGSERRIRAPRDGTISRESDKGPKDESGLL